MFFGMTTIRRPTDWLRPEELKAAFVKIRRSRPHAECLELVGSRHPWAASSTSSGLPLNGRFLSRAARDRPVA